MTCVGTCVPWLLNNDWDDTELNVEINKLCDQLGLNHWEAFAGIPPEFAVKFLRAVAYRKGEGDIWAEGVPRAAEILGLKDQVWKTHKHGYGPHWDGRNLHFIHYPVWIVSALTWATQGRDPFNQEHGYCFYYTTCVKEWAPLGEGQGEEGAKSYWGKDTISYKEICKAGAKIYGTENALTGWDRPELGYKDKEIPTIRHNHRAIMKSSVPMCDNLFPMLYDPDKPDKVGDIDAELRVFNAVVGTDWTLDDMHKACERAFNVMRALHVRQGTTRAHDESVIPYFQQPANWPDEPAPQELDARKFRDLLERYYKLRGWDKATAGQQGPNL